jgi:hypothetical protein
MLDAKKSLRACLILGMTAIVTACSGGNGSGLNNGNGNGLVLGGPSPVTLVSTCDQICSNIVATCVESPSLDDTCQSVCGDLSLVVPSCLDQFAGYLTCIAGATSVAVSCGPDGADVLVTPPQCEGDLEETQTCNASPGLVSACIAIPANPACGGLSTEFCVGAPETCSAPSPNPLGIGVYCCPS